MSEELYFNNELRNCLDAAVYSDCGENDQWNYWYQRLRKAHDAAVDRVTETQRAENAKLREQIFWLKQGDILHVLTDQEYIDQCERERLMQVSIDALDKENAKLREEFDKMDVWHSKELLAAIDENKKLRELVADMYACIGALCSMVENSPGCSMCLTNQDEEKPCAAADVYCRMRELGVDK